MASFREVMLFVAVYCSFRQNKAAVEQQQQQQYWWDDNGYIIYCPCMGRFGNQVAHFLGALQFAKDLNRTLTLPPFRTYVRPRNVPFKEWFKPEVVAEYHKSVPLEEFLEYFGHDRWPEDKRVGYCYRSSDPNSNDCQMKHGNPFGPFWNELGINFTSNVFTHLTYDTSRESLLEQWKEKFPPSAHPILAFKGAPASFPVHKRNRNLQQYLVWNDQLASEALNYITNEMSGDKFIAVHLRIGSDWDKACEHAIGTRSFMESLMCLEDLSADAVISKEICRPSTDDMIKDIKHIIKTSNINNVFIGSDVDPPLQKIRMGLGNDVAVHYMNPHGPQLDVVMFELADHFIGNCVSSLSAIAVRARNIKHKQTSFWGLIDHHQQQQRSEL